MAGYCSADVIVKDKGTHEPHAPREGKRLIFEMMNGEEFMMGILGFWTVDKIKRELKKQNGFEVPTSQIALIRLKDSMMLDDDGRCAEPLDLVLEDCERLQVVILDNSDSDDSRETDTEEHQCVVCYKFNSRWRAKKKEGVVACRRCQMEQARLKHGLDMKRDREAALRKCRSGGYE